MTTSNGVAGRLRERADESDRLVAHLRGGNADLCREAADRIEALERELAQRDELLIKAEKLRFSRDITVESRGPSQWAVCDGGMVLNSEGEWEYEPLPSNRIPEFIARTRFTFAEAVTRARAIVDNPSSAKTSTGNRL